MPQSDFISYLVRKGALRNAQPPNVQLFGIVVDDEGARAIVRSGTEKVDRVQIGDDIGGWKVSQIEGRRLVLSLDGRFATFTLFSNDSGLQTPRDAEPRAGPVTNLAEHAASGRSTSSWYSVKPTAPSATGTVDSSRIPHVVCAVACVLSSRTFSLPLPIQ
jgi:hypothetical protein